MAHIVAYIGTCNNKRISPLVKHDSYSHQYAIYWSNHCIFLIFTGLKIYDITLFTIHRGQDDCRESMKGITICNITIHYRY